MREWTEDNPKAALMQRKRALIVAAARAAFLDKGYAESSMGRIAQEAGVSIKTVYRHFENKDDLFSAVMHAACTPAGIDSLSGGAVVAAPAAPAAERRQWAEQAPDLAFALAGIDYLTDLLGEEQLALYRVVTQDAHRVPALGARYKAEMYAHREALLIAYLAHWAGPSKWQIKDPHRAASTFLALLRAELFDDALLGLRRPTSAEIAAHARQAADRMLVLLDAHGF